jgi:predicted  nucleic acid-binding Zn-ribbon protein
MSSKNEKPKSKVSQLFSQARASLKLLETIEREALAKARTFVRNPIPMDRKRLTNEKILASLKAIGVATQSEVEALELKVHALEDELHSLRGTIAKAATEKSKATKRGTATSTEQQPPADAVP